jgi:hypothetical protein
MFARLVTGRYSQDSDGAVRAGEVPQTGWFRRVITALFSRKK